MEIMVGNMKGSRLDDGYPCARGWAQTHVHFECSHMANVVYFVGTLLHRSPTAAEDGGENTTVHAKRRYVIPTPSMSGVSGLRSSEMGSQKDQEEIHVLQVKTKRGDSSPGLRCFVHDAVFESIRALQVYCDADTCFSAQLCPVWYSSATFAARE